jgi:class 3 adenylate cyclase
MDRAVKSTAVVSSLFPENVRDRLLDDDDNNKECNKWLASEMEGLAMLKSTRSLMADGEGSSSMHESPSSKLGKPIADRFLATTIMFADLAGFTNWTASRKPEDVFVLLETLYGAFDAIALRREVFKVEVRVL